MFKVTIYFLVNSFENSNYFFCFFWSFCCLFYLFLGLGVIYYKVCMVLLFSILGAALLATCDGDLFSGFLLAAEVPAVLVCLVISFNKYAFNAPATKPSLVSFSNFTLKLISCTFVFLLYLTYVNTYLGEFDSIFIYNVLLDADVSLGASPRNDMLLHYIFYYCVEYLLVVFLAVLLLVVSCIAILFYFNFKQTAGSFLTKKNNAHFLRKQALLRQGAYSPFTTFFKKK